MQVFKTWVYQNFFSILTCANRSAMNIFVNAMFYQYDGIFKSIYSSILSEHLSFCIRENHSVRVSLIIIGLFLGQKEFFKNEGFVMP